MIDFQEGVDFTEAEVVEALRTFASKNGVENIPPKEMLKRVGFGKNIREDTGCTVGLRAK